MQTKPQQGPLHSMAMPTFEMLPCDHPAVALSLVLRQNQVAPLAIDILPMARYAPLECLSGFIHMLRNGLWGSFWNNYFGRMIINNEQINGENRGCYRFGEHLLADINGAMKVMDHTGLIDRARRLLGPLEQEVFDMASFFHVSSTVPGIHLPQAMGRTMVTGTPPGLKHFEMPAKFTRDSITPAPSTGSSGHNAIVPDPIITKMEPSMLPIEQVQPGYRPMLITEIAEALKGVRLSQEYTLIIQDKMRGDILNMKNKDRLTLADVLRMLAWLTTSTDRMAQDGLIGSLCAALFDHEKYHLTMRPDPKPLELANMIWSLVVHCGYNFINHGSRYRTATGLTVRANIFARLVFELYQGKTKTAILNSLHGQITIDNKAPVKTWRDLGFFPDLFQLLR